MKLRELQQELRTTDPAALLVSSRVLDRVIRQENRLPAFRWQVPHRHCLVVHRHVLFRHVEQDELDLESDRLLPATVILLERPSAEELAAEDRQPLLLKYWRLLFHASVHLALQDRLEEGGLSANDIQARIDQIGRVEFAEIRRVLTEDDCLLPGADDAAVYVEFVAVFLELHCFAANLLPASFPGLPDRERIRHLLLQDVDAAALLHRSRLSDAADPVVRNDTRTDEPDDYFWKLIHAAKRADEGGNTVRAAILRTSAARVAPAAYTASTRLQAEVDLKQLVQRLQAALQLSDAEAEEWLKDLPTLLDKADQGTRPVEAVLLGELQQVCLDHERDIYALDLVEWVLSVGRRPIKRPLPSQRVVRIARHLRNATQLLARARLSDADRQHLAQLMETALARSEERLRDRFRPVLTETFLDVGLRPSNPPERTAYHKMIEELLDRISAYGFLTFGDLRDAISRNQLKLPNLNEPEDFIRGDPLLRLDRRLATLLDGVYRPAEFYQRWLERFTSLNFGTVIGRSITRCVTVPFGGAWVVVEGIGLLLEHMDGPPLPAGARYGLLLLVAFFLLGLLHSAAFRRRCRRGLARVGHALHVVLIDVPARLLQHAGLRRVLASWPFRLFTGYLVIPLAICSILWAWVPEAFATWLGASSTFLAVNFVLNSRPGRAAGEALLHGLARLYDLLRAGLLPGLFRLIVAVFKRAIDMVEYVLFSVDEWLRFRSGDSQLSLMIRTVLGVLWFPISYISRFYMLVLIEPGINPIKFPISSVAAKFIYPFGVTLAGVMAELLAPLTGQLVAGVIAGTTVWLLPDAFGFLFWEMKENWSLYRANRSPALRPVPVGTHGETVRRLLQPGFHSGTLPKFFARLRHAERTAVQTGSWQAVRVIAHGLAEVERALQRLVDREVAALVRQSPLWDGQLLSAGRVVLASNRISLELVHPGFPDDSVWIDIEDQEGWLVAGLRGPGWLAKVSAPQRQAVTVALAGFYKLAGIDLIHEQIQANLPLALSRYEIVQRGLRFWPDGNDGTPILYEWNELEDQLQPLTPAGEPAPAAPPLSARRLVFAHVPITWHRWVSMWQNDQVGLPAASLFDVGLKLLPMADAG